ncbi:MAG: rhodanese-like domain-containing protein [Elusimicrobiales bacterium]|nr:rhodanese-like domain-containing protein [Elusimicrobiales bacterium]
MKTTFFACLLLAAAVSAFAGKIPEAGPAPDPVRKEASQFPLNVPPADAKTWLESATPPVLLDVRTPAEFAAGHLAGAANMDYKAADFKDRMSALDKAKPYLIYCRTGHRSGLALAIMRDLGFKEYHDIAGGITAWTQAGYPVVK